jgi:hypothetical protein
MFVDLPENRDQQVLVPDLQGTLTFHEKPLAHRGALSEW